MFKAIIMLTRSDVMTRAEFAQWWLHEHAVRAAALPNVRRIAFNLVEGDHDQGFDGVSELWFDSRDDFDAAYASDIGTSVAADTMAHVSARTRVFVTEHVIVPV